MDNFLLHAIATEMEEALVGRRFGKIYQIGATDLAMDLHLRDDRWLMIATDPQRLALYLTTRNPKKSDEEARTDTPFVALAKKYLDGGRLIAMEKLGYDRVVRFEFAVEDEAGRTHPRELVVLLTGRAANVLVVEQGRILASLREREEAVESYRDPAPPADRIDPFQLTAEALEESIAAHSGEIATAAARSLLGFTSHYAEELRHRAAARGNWEALQSLLHDLFEAPPKPTIYAAPSLEELRRNIGCAEFSLLLSPIELDHLAAMDHASAPTVNDAAEIYAGLLQRRRAFQARKQKLVSQLSQQLKKQRTLAANLNRERAGFALGETHQRYGELLLANLHQAVKEEAGFVVTDFYDPEQAQITIPAANKPTAQEAAEHYFRLARKSRHGRTTIAARLPAIEAEVEELSARLQQIETITSEAALQELGVPPLAARPASKQRPAAGGAPRAKDERIAGVRRYRSTDGFEVLVGRTDRDNDTLTFRLAKSFDIWMHAADYPGSHVILRNPKRGELPPRAIAEAAQLAAKFSQARANTKVAVNYCERKFVTKMKGFAPGQVRLSSFKTILVEPAEAGERIG
ncbi:MAG: NFACT family protein [Blastocatellia bacterium]|nr:NFACT family protein [Blastocatellia bacterium]